MQKRSGKKSGGVESADSIGQAAARLSIDVRILRSAKRAGCPAFAWSRVNLLQLEEWLTVHPEFRELNAAQLAEQEGARIEKVARALTRRESYRQLHRQFVHVDEVRRSFTRAVAASKAMHLAIPSAALCKNIANLSDPIEIEQVLKTAQLEALKHLAEGKWPACKCPKCGTEIKP